MNNLNTSTYNTEAEQSVIGGLLIKNDSIDRIADILRPEMFYFQDHKETYKTIIRLIADNKAVDVVTLSSVLDPNIIDLGGLVDIQNSTPSAANIRRYAEIVRERWQAREAERIAEELKINASDKEKNIQSIVTESMAELEALVEENSSTETTFEIADIFMDAVKLIEARKNGTVSGLDTGLVTLNKLLNISGGDFVIIAGRPSMGKTLIANMIAQHVAMSKHVFISNLEMMKVQSGDRFLSSVAGIDVAKIQSGDLSQDDYALLAKANKTVKQMRLTVDYKEALSFEQIRLKARAANRKEKLGLIVIDYIQLMTVAQKMPNRNAEIEYISRGLKNLAKELNVPIIGLAQLNRDVEKRVDKRPLMSDLRDSGSLEQDADIVLMMYRDEVYNENTRLKGILEVGIKKNRQGKNNVTAHLAFRGEQASISDLAHGWSLPEEETQGRQDNSFD